MSRVRANPPRRRKPLRPPAKDPAHAQNTSLIALLDDELDEYSVGDWRSRNLRLTELLTGLGLYDDKAVPSEAHRVLTDALIHLLNNAATDPQNAGHVRAQNENVLHYGLAASVPKTSLTIALEAGFIHDLNKAMGEPLRQDEYGVLDTRGRKLPLMTTMAQIVGLNHLGERTRAAIHSATRLPNGALDLSIAQAIDRTIVHHGLGSSRFIQDLLNGRNPWWGDGFVNELTGERKLTHPEQPPLTIESVIHDLADSTQQMQGGAAWLMKYPAGFWRASGRSLADMMSSGDVESSTQGSIPLSLRLQIVVESATCEEIINVAAEAQILDAERARALRKAIDEATDSSSLWIEDNSEYLANANGGSVYHDVGRALGVSAEDAHARLKAAIAGTHEANELETLVWESGRRVDLERARALAHKIQNTRLA
jgi:hypothetical protein